jgi:cytochrome b involved in lipid metabolism
MASPKLYRRDEVANKNNSQGAWIVIHNSVYNVTEFLNEVSTNLVFYCYVTYKKMIPS